MKKNFKKYLKNLERKRSGIHPDPEINLLMDRNERIIPHDSGMMELLSKRIKKINLNLYPEIEPFCDKVASWLSVDKKNVFLTEGVSGAIKAIIETIGMPGKEIIFPSPTFALYPVYSKMFDMKYKTIGYAEDYRLEFNRMIDLINKKTSIIFLPNPNVPIEGALTLQEIMTLAKHAAKHDSFVVIDEVYFSFGGPTAISLIDKLPNIFIMRSFSKAFGLAGIRLGYIVSSEDNIDYVSKMRTGYETNTLSIEAASFFIENYSAVESYIDEVKNGLNYLKQELNKMGLIHTGGNVSNFVYVKMKNKRESQRIVEKLQKKNIYVRGNWPEPYASGFSVTGAPKNIMEKFVVGLKGVLNGR